METKKTLEWRECSESQLTTHMRAWMQECSLKDTVILLEGEMGAGKSTWARAMLQELCPMQITHGSPTFPLVQEYQGVDVLTTQSLRIYHIDLYRLKNENELQDSGIERQIEEPGVVALVEWVSLFPEFFRYWTSSQHRRKKVFQVTIEATAKPNLRNYIITEL